MTRPVASLADGPDTSSNGMTITVPEDDVADLRARLARVRWPNSIDGVGWTYGTDPVYLTTLLEYWRTEFDWRATEAALNRRDHLMVRTRGPSIHVVRGRIRGRTPLLLLHGWPGSFVQMLDLNDLLDAEFAEFEVVIASLPGFGFSGAPRRPGMSERGAAVLMHDVMAALGHRRYAVHGSDFGAGVAQEMAIAYADHVIGIHLSGTSPHAAAMPPDATPAETEYLRNVRDWRATEVGYAEISKTKPQTLAVGLSDSPAGTASWIVEKFRRWSDCDGDVERRFTKDQLLLNISVYWFTNTIASSVRFYYESARDPQALASVPDVPTAHLMSVKDMFATPREWIARTSRVDRWTQLDRGGHFLEWEEPQLVAEDLVAFFREHS